MNRKEYEAECKRLYEKPHSTETPPGQKFSCGDIVIITKPNSWFAHEKYGRRFEVLYSYYQKYEAGQPRMQFRKLNPETLEDDGEWINTDQDRSKNQYFLRHLWEDNASAWYDGGEIELLAECQNPPEPFTEKEIKDYQLHLYENRKSKDTKSVEFHIEMFDLFDALNFNAFECDKFRKERKK